MLRMARLLLTVAAALVGLATSTACTPEPRVRPERLYLSYSEYCGANLLRLVDSLDARFISVDLLVVDAVALNEARADVVGRSACTSIEIGDDPVELQLRAVAGILELLAGLPDLPADRQYGLVGGVYWDDPDCAEGGSSPIACGMSGPFGDVPPADDDADAGPDGGVADRLRYWLTCRSLRDPCLGADDCNAGTCEPTQPVCARDEQCHSTTCGDEGVCREGTCENASGACIGTVCGPNATCDGADCQTPAGTPCVPGTCQDYVLGEELAPLYPISYPYCSVLYRDALAAD
jgi:hypothetical protein